MAQGKANVWQEQGLEWWARHSNYLASLPVVRPALWECFLDACESISLTGRCGDPVVRCSDKLHIPLGTSLGKHCNTILKLSNEPLDVDVIVTSFLESNIHSLRHNYFHLNRYARRLTLLIRGCGPCTSTE